MPIDYVNKRANIKILAVMFQNYRELLGSALMKGVNMTVNDQSRHYESSLRYRIFREGTVGEKWWNTATSSTPRAFRRLKDTWIEGRELILVVTLAKCYSILREQGTFEDGSRLASRDS